MFGLIVILALTGMALWFGVPWLISLFGPIALVLITIGLTLVMLLLVYFYLAPNNYFFTFVNEATSKIIVKAGKFEKAFIQWKRHTLDENWNIVSEDTWVKDGKVVAEGTVGAKKYKEPWHPFGGLRYYGLWPIKDVYTYYFAWTGVTQEGEIDIHPKEKLDYILLRDDVYWFAALEQETKEPELLPVDVEILLTIRVVNPYKALFAIENWLETVINRVKPITRDCIGKYFYDELISRKGRIGDEIQGLAEEAKVLDDFLNRYGVEIRKIELKDVNPTAKPTTALREATLKKFLAEQEKKAIIVMAEAVSRRRTQETVGAIIQMISQATGRTIEEVQTEIKANRKLSREFEKFSEDLIRRQIAIDGKSFLDIRIEGARGIEKTLLNLIAAFKKIPTEKP